MSQRFKFEVEMWVPDEDQTDPVEMADLIHAVLDCKPGAGGDWRNAHDEMEASARPVWIVRAKAAGGLQPDPRRV